MSGLYTVDQLSRVERGTYVRVRGTLRAATPIEAPFGDEALVGYHTSCAVFMGRPPAFDRTLHAMTWSDASIADDTGQIALDLEGSRVKAPAGEERTLDDEDEILHAVRRLRLRLTSVPSQLQLIERLVPHEREVTIQGVLDVLGGGGFRVSAKQQRILRGDRQRPLVIVPR